MDMPTLTDVEALRRIDEKISEHKAAILALSTLRNTHCAISKLPAEIIADIFLHSNQYFEDPSHSELPDRKRHWLNVSSVCRQWRAIVLDTPRFWCSIDLSWQTDRALEMLKRSKSVPLHVQCTSLPYETARFEPIAKAVMSRTIRELDIGVPNIRSLSQLLESNQSGSAPALEVLKLRSFYNGLPLQLPWHDMPALRVLELHKMQLLSNLPMLPCLTRLVVTHCQRESQPQTFASWLIQSLRSSPLIEEIVISEMVTDFGVELPPSPQISLPKLTFLRIEAARLSLSRLLDYIDYPEPANIEFVWRRFLISDHSPNLSSLQRLCSRFAARARTTPTDQVLIDIRSTYTVQFRPSDPKSRPSFVLVLPSSRRHIVTQFVQMCSTLPFAAIRTLALDGFNSNKAVAWFALFPLFQQATTLQLTDCHAVTAEGLLAARHMPKPPLEKLETIIMNKCVFYSPKTAVGETQLCSATLGVLQDRAALGVAIRKLKVTQCAIAEHIIKEFKEHVEVDWDGVEVGE